MSVDMAVARGEEVDGRKACWAGRMDSEGMRVRSHRALKPAANSGGRCAKRWVWKLSV